MNRIFLSVLLIMAVVFFSKIAKACYQTEWPSVRLEARILSGQVMWDGKPVPNAWLTLYKVASAQKVLGNMDTKGSGLTKIFRTEAGNDGIFRFGELPIGKYVILWNGVRTYVDIVTSAKKQSDTVVITEFADGCYKANIVRW